MKNKHEFRADEFWQDLILAWAYESKNRRPLTFSACFYMKSGEAPSIQPLEIAG